MKSRRPATLGQGAYSIDSLALSNDGKILVASGWFGGNELYAFALSARPRELPLRKTEQAFHHIALSPDGKTIYGASREQGLRTERWSVFGVSISSPATPTSFSGVDRAEIESIAISPDGATLAVCSQKSTRLFDVALRAPKGKATGDALSCAAYTPNGKAIVGLLDSGNIGVLDAQTLKRTTTVMTKDSALRQLSLSYDGRRVAVASYDPERPIRSYSLITKKPLSDIPQHDEDGVTSVALSPDDKRLASCGEDGHVRVWDLATKKLLLDVHHARHESMGDVVFLPAGDLIAAGGRDVRKGPPVYIWRIP